jgi:hypothetical protein
LHRNYGVPYIRPSFERFAKHYDIYKMVKSNITVSPKMKKMTSSNWLEKFE